jgi:hypothetical protein
MRKSSDDVPGETVVACESCDWRDRERASLFQKNVVFQQEELPVRCRRARDAVRVAFRRGDSSARRHRDGWHRDSHHRDSIDLARKVVVVPPKVPHRELIQFGARLDPTTRAVVPKRSRRPRTPVRTRTALGRIIGWFARKAAMGCRRTLRLKTECGLHR